MTTSSDLSAPCSRTAVLPTGPFVANSYHFGMLLGVSDLETDQGYHRGKGWLHQSWLHGDGVVWGLDVTVDPAHREIKVGPGLAVTAAGREVYLDREYCVDIGAWFADRRPDNLVVDERDDGARLFTVHVLAAPLVCLDRPVPAISEPCSGAGTDTAYSRTVESARLTLAANAAPARSEPYPKVRQLLGVAAAADADVTAALAEIGAAAPADRTGLALRWLRAFAAEDVTARSPVPPTATPFAADPQSVVVLAEVAVRLLGDDSITDTGPDATVADIRVRSAHLATTTLAELAVAGFGDPGAAAPAGPQLDPATLTLTDDELSVSATAALEPGTVTADTVTITAFDAGTWTDVVPAAVMTSPDATRIAVALGAAITARPVRVVVTGTGPAPVADPAGNPLAGVLGTATNPTDTGTDAVLMLRS